MKARIPSLLLVFVLWFIVFTTFSTLISAKIRKLNKKKNQKDRMFHGNNPSNGSNSTAQSPVFNIRLFGATGTGVSDDSKALIAAWTSACKVSGAVVQIPSGFKFLLKPVTLQGPCMPNLVLQIDGIVLASEKVGAWPKSSLYQWLNFKWLKNFTIQGSGTADGQGHNRWNFSKHHQKKKAKKVPSMKPTALRFYASSNVTVRDIRIINSPLCHLKFDNSQGVNIDNITISSPGNSPNTDGIHLQNSQDIVIQHSNIGSGMDSGDDCVSIQTGCSSVHIHHITCNPGHGISLGGLGKNKSLACVSDIVVESIIMQNALYGARIKTWQGGAGWVKNVSFSNIHMADVNYPIMIDQYYCDNNEIACKNQTGAVAIHGVKFSEITGTYSTQPIHLACSNSIPCSDVGLISIQLEPSNNSSRFKQPLCSNSYGKSSGHIFPTSIDSCLKSGIDFLKRISHEISC